MDACKIVSIYDHNEAGTYYIYDVSGNVMATTYQKSGSLLIQKILEKCQKIGDIYKGGGEIFKKSPGSMWNTGKPWKIWRKRTKDFRNNSKKSDEIVAQ